MRHTPQLGGRFGPKVAILQQITVLAPVPSLPLLTVVSPGTSGAPLAFARPGPSAGGAVRADDTVDRPRSAADSGFYPKQRTRGCRPAALSLTCGYRSQIFWSGSFYYRLDGIQPLLPAAALARLPEHLRQRCTAFRAPSCGVSRPYHGGNPCPTACMTIAALIAVLMSVADKRLHQHTHNSLAANLPPLLGLESLLFKVLGAGFVLLTLTLAMSGILFSEEIFHKPFQLNHKNLFTLIAWAGVRTTADRTANAGLARTHRSTLDTVGFQPAAAGLYRLEIRSRSAAASTVT